MPKPSLTPRLAKFLASWKGWPRLYRLAGFVFADAVVVALSLWLAFLVRFDGAIPPRYLIMLQWLIPIVLGIKLPVFFLFRAYQFSWPYVGLEELFHVILSCGVGSLAFATLLFLLHNWPPLSGFPRSTLAIDFAFTLLGAGAVRLSNRITRYLLNRSGFDGGKRKVLIVGAGAAGEQLVRNLKQDKRASFWPVGFLDDDPRKWGLSIHGVPVLGPRNRLPEVMRTKSVDTVIIAMPSAPSRVIRETVELARKGQAKEIKIVPFLSELYTGEVKISDAREVRPEDVLPREPVPVELGPIEQFLRGKRVLVTGAAGSIGSELCRQILRFTPAQLVALDFDETGLFNLEMELGRLFPQGKVKTVIANVRERQRIAWVFQQERPQVVFHAAAYKHVPLMEVHPGEAVKTNVFGTLIVAEEASRKGAEAFVLISTDKAVNPVSIMGMTKRVAEMITLAIGGTTSTRFMVVRFGNVLGSRGSVIPIFLDQIRRGGPVTVTHPEMERYFMTTSEAVLLVLQAAAMGSGGEVFVLDMGKPVKILDLAKELIRFHGLEPDKDIPIVFTGPRPGEKLREEILTAEEGTEATTHKQIFVAKISKKFTLEELMGKLEKLAKVVDEQVDADTIKRMLKEIIYGSEDTHRSQ